MDKLLLIDDEADVQYSFRRIFNGPDIQLSTASSGEEGLKLIPRLKPDLVIMDVRMGGISGLETLRRLRQTDARTPVIMMTAYGSTQTAIEAMKLGAYDYLLKPFDVPKLKQIVYSALKAAREMKQAIAIQPADFDDDTDAGIVGRSEAMQTIFKTIGQLSASDATVLITGESGTGKELVARAIYQHSRRSKQPFLAINCAAIPENLLESELFGHEKGAFTGATTQRIGKFEQGNHGTLFLDEVGDMSLATQAKILRVLQDGSFERVGGNQTVRVDVRIIAATNKQLEKAVADGQFREDLFYRLNVVRIHLPPLRERREDIKLLAGYFLRKFSRQLRQPVKSISPEAMEFLLQHSWPGNVRELENAIQRALIMSKGDVLLPADFTQEILSARQAKPEVSVSPAPIQTKAGETNLEALARQLFDWAKQDSRRRLIPAVERELVIHALRETKGNQVHAARLLGISRATLRKRIEKFGIQQQISVQ